MSARQAGVERLSAWNELLALRQRSRTAAGLFAVEPDRGLQRRASCAGLTLDYSRHLVDDEVVRVLVELAHQAELHDQFADMVKGAHLNLTEDRAVLHTALRAANASPLRSLFPAGVVEVVHHELDRMSRFAEEVRSGTRTGATGKRLRNVVNIGIGGSDLGPALFADVIRTLRSANGVSDPIERARFVSNIDGVELLSVLAELDPAETLFVVVSKTFSTVETLTNAQAARNWLSAALGVDAVAQHFVAVSTNAERVQAFGIAAENMFVFWDWVGGRYSLPSAAGLGAMVAVGPEAFAELLRGMRTVDEHMFAAPVETNVPMMMGLLGLWCRHGLGARSHAVVPYARALSLLPAYLQQLEMESNGKRVDQLGADVTAPTAPVVWGTPGTNGQHAYFQLLHQGTDVISIDLLGSLAPMSPRVDQHELLLASLLAQARALAFGRPVSAEVAAHRAMPGNRPCSLIMVDQLDAAALGRIIACYEHRVFVMGRIWGIDSFDQWGVELGKELATTLVAALRDPGDSAADDSHLDSSTRAWLGVIAAQRSSNTSDG